MAPEYATRGSLTYKADIYSFGVVTLEIVSGQINTNCISDDEFLHLLDWVRFTDLYTRKIVQNYIPRAV